MTYYPIDHDQMSLPYEESDPPPHPADMVPATFFEFCDSMGIGDFADLPPAQCKEELTMYSNRLEYWAWLTGVPMYEEVKAAIYASADPMPVHTAIRKRTTGPKLRAPNPYELATKQTEADAYLHRVSHAAECSHHMHVHRFYAIYTIGFRHARHRTRQGEAHNSARAALQRFMDYTHAMPFLHNMIARFGEYWLEDRP